jgi:hypothetical protein
MGKGKPHDASRRAALRAVAAIMATEKKLRQLDEALKDIGPPAVPAPSRRGPAVGRPPRRPTKPRGGV